MKYLLLVLSLLLAPLAADAAYPPLGRIFGSNGVVVITNATTGAVIVDGSTFTNGGSAVYITTNLFATYSYVSNLYVTNLIAQTIVVSNGAVYTLVEGANVTFTTNGAELTISVTAGSGTPFGNQGYVQWNSNGVFKADGQLVYNSTNHSLGIGTNNPQATVHIVKATGMGSPVIFFEDRSGGSSVGLFSVRGNQGIGSESTAGVSNWTFYASGRDRITVTTNGLVPATQTPAAMIGTPDAAFYTNASQNVWISNSLVAAYGTLGAGKVLTDVSGNGSATWVAPSGGLSGTTNILNLSVQAAKLPSTNYPAFQNGYQDWETVYYETNYEGSRASLSANWQFIVPPDYATNSLKVRVQSMLVATNGPNSSNVVWRASIFRATPGDSTDVHTGSFGASVSGTVTWAASFNGTNKVQQVVIDMSTSSLIAAGDLAILKLDRDAVTDTYGGATSLVGLQLEYTRP